MGLFWIFVRSLKCPPNILPCGNKSGRQIWAFFVEFLYALYFWSLITLWLMVSLWQPHSTPCLISKILNFSNNHFGQLTSVKFQKIPFKEKNFLLIHQFFPLVSGCPNMSLCLKMSLCPNMSLCQNMSFCLNIFH